MVANWEANLNLGNTLDELAAEVERDAKRYAPVDTGALSNSIRHEVSGTGTDAEARIGSDLDYSLYQELGTSRQSGTPYLRPALNQQRR